MTKRSLGFLSIIVSLFLLISLAWLLVWRSSFNAGSPVQPTIPYAQATGETVDVPPAEADDNAGQGETLAASTAASIPVEQPAIVIPLAGPAAEARAEISGMAWYGETLVLLPQYPGRFGQNDGLLFGLAKQDILAYLDGEYTTPLSPVEIPLQAPGITRMDGFQGFESIAFAGNQIYLTIEAKPEEMMGYLVTGTIQPDLSEVRLDINSLVEIPPPVQIENMTDEAILVVPNQVLTFFEANGFKNNPAPSVHVFSLQGKALETLPMVNLEYRLTDVTPLDGSDHFWGINYFYPGDVKLTPVQDPLASLFGEGSTHSLYVGVERLVQFQYSIDGITLTGTPPIQLQLIGDDQARNWEAIAMLDARGFLLATDKYPQTIFAFVSLPEPFSH